MIKTYNLAIVCGRFQPLHKGHISIIRKALSMAKTVGLYIGSCNNVGTPQNPFTFEERYNMIDKIFHTDIANGKLIIKPLYDREHPSDDTSWGKYYLDCIHKDFGIPDLFVYGNDKVRNQWFTEDDLKGIDTISVNRDEINISATELRKTFLLFNTACLIDYPILLQYFPDELRTVETIDFIKKRLTEVNKG